MQTEERGSHRLKSWRLVARRLGREVQAPVRAFMEHGGDFVVRQNLRDWVDGMNQLTGDSRLKFATVERVVRDRDLQVRNRIGKDPQLAMVREARPLLDPARGPLIAAKMNILTRKTLGGLETDLQARVLGADGHPLRGLYAAGEVAGFGGGGMHGYRSLECTFLDGCLFSGRIAGGSI